MLEDQRQEANPQSSRVVKASVPLDVDTHVRLAAVAALRGVDRGALAASLIRDGLKGLITIIDKQKPREPRVRKVADAADPPGEGDRPGEAA
jgi:hypothetical protein